MAYKFQMGTFKPSGSISIIGQQNKMSGSGGANFRGSLTIGNGGEYGLTKSGVAKIASMGENWTNASRTVADMGTVTTGIYTTVDINGGAIDGTVIGGNSAVAGTFAAIQGTSINASTTITATGNISGAAEVAGDTAKFGGLNFEGNTASGGVLTSNSGVILFGASADQELRSGVISGSSRLTIAGDLKVGNGGAYGLTSAGAATIASMAANWTNAGRTVADAGTLTTVDINGGAIDGTVIGAASAVAGTFAALKGTTISGSGALTAAGALTVAGNTNLMGTLDVVNGACNFAAATMSGLVTAEAGVTTTTLSASTTVQMAGNLSVGGSGYGLTNAGAATIASMAGNWTNAGRTVADAGTLTTVDINGGAIDGTVIGAASAADVTATDLILGASSGVLYLNGDGGTAKIGCNSGNNVSINAPGDVTFNPGGLNILPENDGTIDLGSSAKEWKDLYVDGIAYVDQLGASGDGAIVYATTISASSNLEVGGNVTVNGNLSVDGTVTYINTTSLLVTDKNVLIASGSANAAAAAGAGLTVAQNPAGSTNIQWVYKQNGEGDAASSGDIWMASGSSGLFDIQCENIYGNVTGDIVNGVQGIGNAAGTLEIGFNYGTTTMTANRVWTLPSSPTVGQIVYVKAPSSLGGYNIQVSGAGTHRIDGEEVVYLQSDFGAANFVYAAANVWRVF